MSKSHRTLRAQIVSKLSQLPEENVLVFKKMYSPDNLSDSVAMVVNRLPAKNLKWALQQVERTFDLDGVKPYTPSVPMRFTPAKNALAV